jgi:hypothetical protein
MTVKHEVIAEYDFDPDKKDTITRYQVEKLLRKIKEEMKKTGKLKVTIEKV